MNNHNHENININHDNNQEVIFEDSDFVFVNNDTDSTIEAAKKLFEQNKNTEAKNLLNILLTAIPEANVFHEVATVLQNYHEVDAAIINYKKAIEIRPDEKNFINDLSRLLCAKLEYTQLETYLLEKISSGKSSVAVYYWLGETLRLQKKTRAAQTAYLLALRLSPDDVMFRLALVTLSLEIDNAKAYTAQYYQNAMDACLIGEVDNAVKFMREAVMLTSINPNTHDPASDEDLDILLSSINKSGDVIEDLSQFVTISDKELNPKKIILLAKIKFVEKDTEGAFKIILEGIDKYHQNEDLPYFYAQNLEKRSLNEALEYLELISSKFSTSFKIQAYCGKLQLDVGKYNQALQHLTRAYQINPDNEENNNVLIEACRKTNNLSQAIEIVRKKINLQSESEESYLLIGKLLAQMNNITEASTNFEMAQKKNPASPKGVLAQARMFLENNLLRDAVIVLRGALSNHQNNTEFLTEYAKVLSLDGQLIDASNTIRQVLSGDPNNTTAKRELADILLQQGEYPEAARYYSDLLQIDKNNSELMVLLAEVYELSGNADGAKNLYKSAVDKNSKFLKAKEKLAFCHLRLEDFARGVNAYEIISATVPCNHTWKNTPKLWRGEPLYNKVLVVYQNLSDAETILFARYLPYLKKMGGNLELLVNTSLVRLLNSFGDAVTDYPRNADFYLPFSAIPKIFNINLSRIPNNRPYIKPDQMLIEKWNNLFGRSKKPRAGIAWRSEKSKGELTHYDKISNIELSMFRDIIRNNPQIEFVSFQTGEKGITEELTNSLPMISGGQRSTDWADLACGVSKVDLCITTDLIVAHIAGAIGVECLVLLPLMASWYWFEQRDTSPWYPSIKLTRQTVMGDWYPLLANIEQELSKLKSVA